MSGSYLEEIAKEYNVEWVNTDLGLPPAQPGIFTDEEGSMFLTSNGLQRASLPVPSPSGYSIPMAPGSNLGNAYSQSSNIAQVEMQQQQEQQQRQRQQQQIQLQQQQIHSLQQQLQQHEQSIQRQAVQNLPNFSAVSHQSTATTPHSTRDSTDYIPHATNAAAELSSCAPPIQYAEAMIDSEQSLYQDKNQNQSQSQCDSLPPPYESITTPKPSSAANFDDLAARFAALQKKN